MTAIEWLVSQLNKQGFAQVVTDEEINQAKEMEKEQLYNFYVQGGIDCVTQADRTVEDFYNETFKSTKK